MLVVFWSRFGAIIQLPGIEGLQWQLWFFVCKINSVIKIFHWTHWSTTDFKRMFPNTPSTPNISVEKRCFLSNVVFKRLFQADVPKHNVWQNAWTLAPSTPEVSVEKRYHSKEVSPQHWQKGKGGVVFTLLCQTLYLNFREILDYYKTFLSAYGVASLRASRKKYVVVEDSRPGCITVYLCSASLRRILGCIGSKGVLAPIS